MAEIVLFHHILGLTDGVVDFADRLRAAGHTVHTPDLFGGRTAASIEDGFALSQEIGRETVDARVDHTLAALPDTLVYAGFSYGEAIAQRLAQTRPGARGALLYESFVAITEDWSFGPWPADVPVQVHGMADDPFFGREGDREAAEDLVAIVGGFLAQVYVYPGDTHLFTDSSLPGYDAAATALVVERSLELLRRAG